MIHYHDSDPHMACAEDHGDTSKVTPDLHAEILRRDRECVLSKIEPWHICRDEWGRIHYAGDLAKLTIEHVKSEPRLGKRAPSDPAHCLALCHAANVGVPNKSQRAAFRAYLAAIQ